MSQLRNADNQGTTTILQNASGRHPRGVEHALQFANYAFPIFLLLA